MARRENCPYLGAEFDWSAQDPDILGSEVNTKSSPVCEFEIEISLTKRHCPVYFTYYLDKDGKWQKKGHAADNSFWLLDEALSCRKFKVRMEKGVFITGEDKKHGLWSSNATNYTYRLVFDSSPYPPQHLWIDSEGDPLYRFRFWEWDEFCAQEEPCTSWMWKVFRRLTGWLTG
jgi:hypothetical protein